MDPVLSNVSTIGLTHDETDDILQKLSGVFPHQMKHILTGVAFGDWVPVTDLFVSNL
jgi:hypothetical protein